MMWPVQKFYSGSNELAKDELRLAAIFHERGREDLANCIINGRKVQRFLFALDPDSSFTDTKTFADLFAGLKRAFKAGDDKWEQWRGMALENWKDDELLLSLLAVDRH
jgi:hypothetical protein